ncbi:MAG: hypothetical protein P4L46_26385 [Fimbriimonas sp.]|nr:hypothetical protein [Fimbriimonas sp.]
MLEALVRRSSFAPKESVLLVLLHGLGADEQDLMGLADQLDPRLTVVCFRAPMACSFGGYAWFDVSWNADGVHADAEQAIVSRDILIDILPGLPARLGMESERMFLGGFSQGAMMSLGVSVARPDIVLGTLVLSGRILPEFVSEKPAPGFENVPFYVQHGTRDEVLPVEGGRAIERYLVGSGCQATYREFPMGHEINLASLQEMNRWLTARLA